MPDPRIPISRSAGREPGALVRFGILEKRAYPEVPPRVEYRLTSFGERFTALMDGVEALQRELDGLRRR